MRRIWDTDVDFGPLIQESVTTDRPVVMISSVSPP